MYIYIYISFNLLKVEKSVKARLYIYIPKFTFKIGLIFTSKLDLRKKLIIINNSTTHNCCIRHSLCWENKLFNPAKWNFCKESFKTLKCLYVAGGSAQKLINLVYEKLMKFSIRKLSSFIFSILN